jgi:hypothetical protein
MTDRIQALTVILDHDMRDDDVQELIAAIKCLRHVGNVITTNPVDVNTIVARTRIYHEIRTKIIGALSAEVSAP